MKQLITTKNIQQALETLWTDMGTLARSPLVEQLGLVEGWSEQDRRDVYKRASALIDTLLGAAHQLKTTNVEAFRLLNRTYGLDPKPQAAHDGLMREATSTSLTEDTYTRRLKTALSALQSELEAYSQSVPRMLTHDV